MQNFDQNNVYTPLVPNLQNTIQQPIHIIQEAVNDNWLRGGIPSLLKKDRIEGPSFGVGLNYPINRMSTLLRIDYSLSDLGPLDQVQRLNLSFNF